MAYAFKESYSKLILKLEKLGKECESILKNNFPESKEELFDLVEKWEKKVEKCINEDVIPAPEFLTESFRYDSLSSTSDEVYLGYGNELDGDGKIELFNMVIKSKLREFQKLKDYLLILNNTRLNPISETPSIQEKMDYILDNFYTVFNDNTYSIKHLFRLSEIQYRDGEPAELGKNLFRKGYVEVADQYSKTECVKLTVKGASYVERKRKANSKKRSQKNEDELNKKVDLVWAKLESLGYGQEIIFEELEELKSLTGKLKKKTWVQLLKGKVIDLAIAQVINQETAQYIFKTLADGTSKLLLPK